MTPVSWVNQASFEPLGLTLAIPKTPSVTEEVVEPEVSKDPELHLEEILKDHPSIRTRSLAFDIFLVEIRVFCVRLVSFFGVPGGVGSN